MKNHSSKDRPVAEAALESSEVIVDALMHGEVLAEIPFIGTAIKICKAADSIRDRAFAIKLSKFVQHLEDITDEQKDKLKEKMLSGTEEAQKIGETLFFVLEHVSDLDKSSLLSQIFLAYIDDVVTSEDLRRLCHAVDTAFADDLRKLLMIDITPERTKESWMLHLVPSGLTQLVGDKTYSGSGNLYADITPLGRKLKIAYLHGKRQPQI